MDFLKKNWMQVLTLVLCAALLVSVRGQRRTIAELEQRVSGLERNGVDMWMKTDLQQQVDELSQKLDLLEQLTESYSVTVGAVDVQARTISLELEAVLPLTNQNVQVSARANEESSPLSRSADGVYTGTLALPVEEAGDVTLLLEVQSGGKTKTEMLGQYGSVMELLPVRLGEFSGDWLYDRERGGMYFAEWCGSLHDPQGADAAVTDAEYRVYQNGKRVFSAPTEKQDTALFQYSTYESGLEGRLFPCAAGDEMELRFACADPYGLGYEFPIKRWKIEDGQAEMHWPTSAFPTLTWPE